MPTAMPRFGCAAGRAARVAAGLLAVGFPPRCNGAADPTCWSGGINEEFCCDPKRGAMGNPECWDGDYSFSRCCGVRSVLRAPVGVPRAAAGQASVAGHWVDPSTVPGIPLLGGGEMPLSGIGMCCRAGAQGDAARQSVLDFLLLGGRLVDDASLYANHAEVGEGIRQAVQLGVPRSEVFLTTKIWADHYGFESALAWVTRSLEELGLEYMDLVLLHVAPVPEDGRECGTPKQCRQETWLALQRAKRMGLVRHLGVSNFGPRQMGELLGLGGEPIEVNQIEYHPWAPALNRAVLDFCQTRGIAVTAYGSMGSNSHAKEILTQDALQKIGAKYGKTAGQVLLRWAVQHNISVIPGTSNPRHMAENLDIFGFALSAEDMVALDNVPEDQHSLYFFHYPDQAP